jgi:hypothetical protein
MRWPRPIWLCWDHPWAACELAHDTDSDVVYLAKLLRAEPDDAYPQRRCHEAVGCVAAMAWPKDGGRDNRPADGGQDSRADPDRPLIPFDGGGDPGPAAYEFAPRLIEPPARREAFCNSP